MKIVLVSERESLRKQIATHFHPQGLEIIQYWNPIKAMDNLDEIDPDVVLFSAKDFPRHWKPFLIFLRSIRDRDQVVFVVLKSDDFDAEEASKAQHIGANGIVHENLEDPSELGRLREIVVRYKDINEVRKEKRYIPDKHDRIGFLFCHPITLQAVSGSVDDISNYGLRFRPELPELVQDIQPETRVPGCSLRIGDEILSLTCEVVRNDQALSLSFTGLTEEAGEKIGRYLKQHINRELESVTHTAG
jgi:hypothetical protein